jgi:NAD(P)-dependent dehydrogenase (short-subunit alcohol dehydrogenase family)
MTDPLFSISDQVVLVSGGSRGIGKAIAKGFAERGAKVIVTGRDEKTLVATANNISGDEPVVPIICDVANSQAIASLVRHTCERFGRIDTLVNVAGVNRRKPALDVTEDDYDFVVDINLKGAFFLAQAVGKQMIQQGEGSIINIESLNSDRPLTNVLPYAMSKAGMSNMTKALATEWGEFGVRVNGLAPGFILTDLTQKLWADEKMYDWGVTNTPLRRLGQPEDLVGTAIFLASPAAAFLTGQTVYVDGGFTSGWEWPIPENNQ